MDKKWIIAGIAIVVVAGAAIFMNKNKSAEMAEEAVENVEEFSPGIADLGKYTPDLEGFNQACTETGGTVDAANETCAFNNPQVLTTTEMKYAAWGRVPGTWQAAKATFDAEENALAICKTNLLKNYVSLVSFEQAASGKEGETYLDLEDNQWIEIPSPKGAPLKYNIVTSAVCKFQNPETFKDDGMNLEFSNLFRQR